VCEGSGWFFFFQAEDGIRDWSVTGVQTCALPISNINNVIARRQPLPRVGGTGLPASPGTPIADIVPEGVENKYGVFGTPAIHFRSEERRVGKEGRTRWGAGR